MEPSTSFRLQPLALGPRYTISIKRLASKRYSTVSHFPALVTVTPGKRVIRVKKICPSNPTTFEYSHHPATTFFRHYRHHRHRRRRVSTIITLPPSNVWWRTSSQTVAPLISPRRGRHSVRYALFKPFRINYAVLTAQLNIIDWARKLNFLYSPQTRYSALKSCENFMMVGKNDERSRGTSSSNSQMPSRARGEGGSGDRIPTSEQYSPTKSRGLRGRRGLSRPPTRQGRPLSRQQDVLHSKADKALLLPRNRPDSLLTEAKKTADPDQKPQPKTPDVGVRTQSRLGQRELTPSMIPGPKNSSRSEQFLNSNFGNLPRPDKSKNPATRMNTPTSGSMFSTPLPSTTDESNIDGPSFKGMTDGKSAKVQLGSPSSEELEEDMSNLRINPRASKQRDKEYAGDEKNFYQIDPEDDKDMDNKQPLPQASEDTNYFGGEEKAIGGPFEPKPLTYETNIYINYRFVFDIEHSDSKVADDKLMDSIKLSALAKELAAEATSKWKAWADDSHTPLQSGVLHMPYAWKMTMHKTMLSKEGQIRSWNERSSDFGDLLSLLSTISQEYKYRHSISDKFSKQIVVEIERYLGIFFEYEDEDTRKLIFRRLLREGIATRKKYWCKGFDQSRQNPANNFNIQEGAVRLTFYCNSFDPFKSAIMWRFRNPEGRILDRVPDDFTVGIDGRITMKARPIEEKPYEFSMPPHQQLPPRTPPKGVPFKEGYKFDGSFFDNAGAFTVPLAIFDVIDMKVDRPRKRYDDENLLIIDGSFARAMNHYIRAAADAIVTVVSKMPGANIQLKVVHGEQVAEGLIRKFKSVLANGRKNTALQDDIHALSEVSVFNCFWNTMCMMHEASAGGRDYKGFMINLQSNLQDQLSRMYGEMSFKQLVTIRPDSQVRIIAYSEDLENSRRLEDTILEFDSRGGSFEDEEEGSEEGSEDENDSGN
ncbi:hypothetical protein TWF679_010051 [Orbilia oligospora]|uniref:Uncharacterized protein n=1 Tax=Orbilia oligospora TaxID=2813651 RepID=A0A8H8V182_ORBOL|nr:hypothetical protein TWF679_010051 [Orbilia oligospora]